MTSTLASAPAQSTSIDPESKICMKERFEIFNMQTYARDEIYQLEKPEPSQLSYTIHLQVPRIEPVLDA